MWTTASTSSAIDSGTCTSSHAVEDPVHARLAHQLALLLADVLEIRDRRMKVRRHERADLLEPRGRRDRVGERSATWPGVSTNARISRT